MQLDGLSELWDIDSLNNEGTKILVMGGSGWKQGVGTQASVIKLIVAGWNLGTVMPISTIVGLLIL